MITPCYRCVWVGVSTVYDYTGSCPVFDLRSQCDLKSRPQLQLCSYRISMSHVTVSQVFPQLRSFPENEWAVYYAKEAACRFQFSALASFSSRYSKYVSTRCRPLTGRSQGTGRTLGERENLKPSTAKQLWYNVRVI